MNDNQSLDATLLRALLVLWLARRLQEFRDAVATVKAESSEHA